MIDKNISSSVKASVHFICRLLNARLEANYQHTAFDETLLNTAFISDFPQSPLFQFKEYYRLADEEFILLLILLTAHTDPDFIDRQLSIFFTSGSINVPELGGTRGENQGLVPTIQTCYFIITGNDIENNARIKALFQPQHFFTHHFIVQVDEPEHGKHYSSSGISMTDVYVELFTTGTITIPPFNSSFPVERITTRFEWGDLVLNNDCIAQLSEIRNWLQHRHLLLEAEKPGASTKPGFSTLFYGPPGTGKSMAATLMAKQFNCDLFRVEINMILSAENKEAEKMLRKIFYLAETKGWILFFDKQATASAAKIATLSYGDEGYKPLMSYLWKAIDHFSGITVFETTDPGKLNEDFLGQFNLRIKFAVPEAEEREQLWKINIPLDYAPDSTVDLGEISKRYLLTGSQISQAVNKIILLAAARHDKTITQADMLTVLEKLFASNAIKEIPGNTEIGVTKVAGQSKKEIKIFVSYSSRDREMKDLIVDRLNAHLHNKPGIKYVLWEDKEIDLGADWQAEIDAALEKSRVALLLVSASFAASKYIMENEVAKFFKAKKEDGCLAIPVLVRNYNFNEFEELSKLNFFKTYYNEYGFDKAAVRHQLMPFDVLGDDEKTTDKKFEDYFRKLSDYIHKSVSSYYA